MTKKLLNRNVWLVYLMNFFEGLAFFIPIFALYVQQELFSVFNVSIIIAVSSISIVIFEVPSGAFSDLFGRKNTLMLSRLIEIIAIIFYLIGGNIYFFIIGAVIQGLAQALLSGTDVALLFDTFKGIKKEIEDEAIALKETNVGRLDPAQIPEDLKKVPSFKKILSIQNSIWPIAASISSFVGGILGAYFLRLPFIITLVSFSLSFIVTLFIKEPKYEKEEKNILTQIKKSSKLIIKKKQIFLLLLISFIAWALGESMFKLEPIFFQAKNIGIEYFGIIYTISFGLSAIGSLISDKVSNKFGNKKTLFFCYLFPFTIIASLLSGFWTAFFSVIGSIAYGITNPIKMHLLNIEVKSKNRATILSIGNFASKLGLAIFAPIFGIMADSLGIVTTFIIGAIFSYSILVPVLLLKDKN